jgi:hypothetical protein
MDSAELSKVIKVFREASIRYDEIKKYEKVFSFYRVSSMLIIRVGIVIITYNPYMHTISFCVEGGYSPADDLEPAALRQAVNNLRSLFFLFETGRASENVLRFPITHC